MSQSLSSLESTFARALSFAALLLVAACSQSANEYPAIGGRHSSSGGAANGATGGNAASGSGGAGTGGGGATGSDGASSGAPGSSGSTSDGGVVASAGNDAGSTVGPPPPSLPPQPNGFQTTIAPLLDAEGCTECHHHGRPIDLTTYPFMTGAATDTATQLVAAFTTNMPPAPRTPASKATIDAVSAWVAGGMKP